MKTFNIKSHISCKYCDIFVKSKEFNELQNLQFKNGIRYSFHDIELNWKGDYTLKSIDSSGYFQYADKLTENYLISKNYYNRFPFALLEIFYASGQYVDIIFDNIVELNENDKIEICLLKNIINFFKENELDILQSPL